MKSAELELQVQRSTGRISIPEAAKETEETLRKPVHIFSTLREDAQPGNYTCIAGESSASIMVASKPSNVIKGSRRPSHSCGGGVFLHPSSIALLPAFLPLEEVSREKRRTEA